MVSIASRAGQLQYSHWSLGVLAATRLESHVPRKYGVVWIVVPISLVSFGARKFQGEVYQHDVQRDGQIAMRSPGRLKCRRNHILSGLLPIEP
jgi:hypothetical protein